LFVVVIVINDRRFEAQGTLLLRNRQSAESIQAVAAEALFL
jgi:hypothetical protein